DHQQTDRDNDRQTRLGLLQFLELAGPDDAVANGELDVMCDPLLRLGYGAAQIATAYAELYRDEALAAFVIDVRSAGIERNIRKLNQRNIGVGAAWRLIADLDVPHG